MDQREFIHRRSGGPVRRPSRHKRPLRKFLWLFLVLVIIAAIVLLAIFLKNRDPQAEEPASSAPESFSQVSSLENSFASQPEETPMPDPSAGLPEQQAPEDAPEDMDTFMIAGGSGYEYYTFNEEVTNSFITTVSEAGSLLSGTATLYSMIIPTATDVMLPESYLIAHSVPGSDQRKAIDDYIYPSITAMNSSIKTVPVFTPLRQHCNEYIFFNSDRTWTQLGAYYAYASFCQTKGVEPAALDSFQKQTYEGFYGGYYRQTESSALYSDSVEAYFSSANTGMDFTDSNGTEYEDYAVISDGSDYDTSLLYLIFTAGDYPYKVLKNKDLSDNSSCIVVQDSFGNFLTPFLTQHYQSIYVVDYSSYNGSIVNLARDTGAKDVILLTQINATNNSSSVESIRNLFENAG